jgi:hypothetical protein
VLSIGSSIVGALFGRKLVSATNLGRAATSARAAGRIARERQDISDAAEGVEVLQQQRDDLEAECKAETEKIQAAFAADSLVLEEVLIQPKKSEINVSPVALVWIPQIVELEGTVESGA